MDLLKFCMLAVTGVAAAVIIKQWKSDFLLLLRLAITLVFGIGAMSAAAPLFQYLQSLCEQIGAELYARVLIKALGIAVLTECCASVCRECGENGAAGGVELTGKINILLLCVPLIQEILSTASELMQMGS